MKKIKLFLKSFPMAGRTFYSLKLHQFVQVKAMYLKGAECGGFTNFYQDARTNITRQMLSYGFLSECILVGEIDTFKFASLEKICTSPDYYAWRAK